MYSRDASFNTLGGCIGGMNPSNTEEDACPIVILMYWRHDLCVIVVTSSQVELLLSFVIFCPC